MFSSCGKRSGLSRNRNKAKRTKVEVEVEADSSSSSAPPPPAKKRRRDNDDDDMSSVVEPTTTGGTAAAAVASRAPPACSTPPSSGSNTTTTSNNNNIKNHGGGNLQVYSISNTKLGSIWRLKKSRRISISMEQFWKLVVQSVDHATPTPEEFQHPHQFRMISVKRLETTEGDQLAAIIGKECKLESTAPGAEKGASSIAEKVRKAIKLRVSPQLLATSPFFSKKMISIGDLIIYLKPTDSSANHPNRQKNNIIVHVATKDLSAEPQSLALLHDSWMLLPVRETSFQQPDSEWSSTVHPELGSYEVIKYTWRSWSPPPGDAVAPNAYPEENSKKSSDPGDDEPLVGLGDNKVMVSSGSQQQQLDDVEVERISQESTRPVAVVVPQKRNYDKKGLGGGAGGGDGECSKKKKPPAAVPPLPPPTTEQSVNRPLRGELEEEEESPTYLRLAELAHLLNISVEGGRQVGEIPKFGVKHGWAAYGLVTDVLTDHNQPKAYYCRVSDETLDSVLLRIHTTPEDRRVGAAPPPRPGQIVRVHQLTAQVEWDYQRRANLMVLSTRPHKNVLTLTSSSLQQNCSDSERSRVRELEELKGIRGIQSEPDDIIEMDSQGSPVDSEPVGEEEEEDNLYNNPFVTTQSQSVSDGINTPDLLSVPDKILRLMETRMRAVAGGIEEVVVVPPPQNNVSHDGTYGDHITADSNGTSHNNNQPTAQPPPPRPPVKFVDFKDLKQGGDGSGPINLCVQIVRVVFNLKRDSWQVVVTDFEKTCPPADFIRHSPGTAAPRLVLNIKNGSSLIETSIFEELFKSAGKEGDAFFAFENVGIRRGGGGETPHELEIDGDNCKIYKHPNYLQDILRLDKSFNSIESGGTPQQSDKDKEVGGDETTTRGQGDSKTKKDY